MEHRVAIIGAGLIGNKRAAAIGGTTGSRLVAVADADAEKARALADEHGAAAATDWRSVLERDDVDVVVAAVYNASLLPVAAAALKSGRHVLCEKPLGRNSLESRQIIASRNGHAGLTVLKTGFNHRFHPALWRAKELLDEGAIGECLNIRARYGHGGRPGMEKEWRASLHLCGGGELLDQGVHVIDLIRWFGGEITEVYGRVETSFWDIEVEDNAMAIMQTVSGASAQFHVSWTNWKNLFSFEVHGSEGYLKVDGLGGSYGDETLEFGRRRREGGRPETEVFNFPKVDMSWHREWQEFIAAIEQQREPVGGGDDGLKANVVIEAMYESSASRRAVRIEYEK